MVLRNNNVSVLQRCKRELSGEQLYYILMEELACDIHT